jgi:predicted alpha/beta-hydrolase family hydrolase
VSRSAEPLSVEGVEVPLSVRLDGAVGDGPLLVFGHGAGAGIDHATTASIAAACADAGVAVLRYQFPFMERQGGSGFGRDAPTVAVATVAAAVARGRSLAGGHPLLAGGHSYGGRMTTHAAAEERLDGVAGLVLLSFPLHGARKPARERGEHLPDVPVPMCFLSGTRDAMAEASLLEAVAADCVDARLEWIADADHGWKAPKRTWPDGPFAELGRRIAAFAGTFG